MKTLKLCGYEIPIVAIEDLELVQIKAVVKEIGLDWAKQRNRLLRDDRFKAEIIVLDGKRQLMLPAKKLCGWLYSINSELVNPKSKEKLIKFQDECSDALIMYYKKGRAEKSRIQAA